jgi:hypothetical protein
MFLHIAGGHLFDNGNKRTGVLALDQFLLFNGYFLFLPEPKITALAERTADRRGLRISDEEMLIELRHTIESNSALSASSGRWIRPLPTPPQSQKKHSGTPSESAGTTPNSSSPAFPLTCPQRLASACTLLAAGRLPCGLLSPYIRLP